VLEFYKIITINSTNPLFGAEVMTHEDSGHYAKKHPPDRKVRSEIANALKKRISDGEMSCAVAHEIAGDLRVSPAEVGFVLDSLEVRIVKCQLGLFGYRPEKKVVKPAETVPQALEEAIQKQLISDRLSCKAAWEIAERFKKGRMEVSSACEALKKKMSPCQLGAF
jgi:hypothetical protein